MEHTGDNIQHVERQHKNDEAQQFLDDRTQLLDTIREMINDEIDRRGVGTEGAAQYSKPPPHHRPRRLTFLQWLRSLL